MTARRAAVMVAAGLLLAGCAERAPDPEDVAIDSCTDLVASQLGTGTEQRIDEVNPDTAPTAGTSGP